LQSPGGFFADDRASLRAAIEALELVQGLWLIKLL
jgi:hypothetical protein